MSAGRVACINFSSGKSTVEGIKHSRTLGKNWDRSGRGSVKLKSTIKEEHSTLLHLSPHTQSSVSGVARQ